MKTNRAKIDLNELDFQIRQGQASVASRHLREIQPAQLNRAQMATYAQLCRRVGHVSAGLRALSPIVRPGSRAQLKPASAREKAEYAVLLQRAGGVREASKLLSEVSHEEYPEADLYRAFCLFNTWEYGEAIPYLRRFASSTSSDYARAVSAVNLVSALFVVNRIDEALALLAETLSLTVRKKFQRLEGNCLELLGHAYLLKGQDDLALSYLESAQDKLGSEASLGSLFVQKWKAILRARAENGIHPLLLHRKEAEALEDWESVRDVDFWILRFGFEENQFHHLMFGTPYAAYRERVSQVLGATVSAGEFIRGSGGGPILDVRSGRILGAQREDQVSGKIHELLEILSRDFYRPQKITSLFGELFPEEYFNVLSSPARIHQLIRRARGWLKTQTLPFGIQSGKGNFKLSFGGGGRLLVPFEREPVDLTSKRIQHLRIGFGPTRKFVANEGAELLGLSISAFRRLAHEAERRGMLEIVGSSTATRYRLRRSA